MLSGIKRNKKSRLITIYNDPDGSKLREAINENKRAVNAFKTVENS